MKLKINKIIFENETLYQGTIKMPKNWDIKTNDIVEHIKQINFNENYNNWFCKEASGAEIFILDYLRTEHKLQVETSKPSEGFIFKQNEISEIESEHNYCDWVCLYGVDIDINSCSVLINSNTTEDKFKFKINQNDFIIFPSSLKYNIENINNLKNNFLQKYFFTKP